MLGEASGIGPIKIDISLQWDKVVETPGLLFYVCTSCGKAYYDGTQYEQVKAEVASGNKYLSKPTDENHEGLMFSLIINRFLDSINKNEDSNSDDNKE